MDRRRFVLLPIVLLVISLLFVSGIEAQGVPRLHALDISLWPEYDDPRVLVIIFGTLDEPNTEVRVPLPEKAELNAVAYVSEDGRLLTAEWRAEAVDGKTTIVVSVPSKQFHVEYYLDAVTPGEKTVVHVRIPVPEAQITQATLTVQQPANTTDFEGDPPLGPLEQGFGGLMYATRNLGALSPGDVVEQVVRYTRLAPGLSTTPRALVTPVPPPDQAPEPGRNWIPVAVGVLIALVIAVLVVLWLRQQSATVAATAPPAPPSKRRKKRRPLSTTTLPKYCPNCGHPFAPNDRFCAMCGTKRA